MNFIIKSKVNFFIASFIIVAIVIFILDLFDKNFKFHDILVESHGLLFDILVLGIILTLYEVLTDKNEKIMNYKNEIDDFRYWNSEESKYRIFGNIKRLIKLNAKDIDLSHCNLSSLHFSDYQLKKTKFFRSNLTLSGLFDSNFEGSDFIGCNLKESHLGDSNFSNCNFCQAYLLDSTIFNCNLNNILLHETYTNNEKLLENLESENYNFNKANYKIVKREHNTEMALFEIWCVDDSLVKKFFPEFY